MNFDVETNVRKENRILSLFKKKIILNLLRAYNYRLLYCQYYDKIHLAKQIFVLYLRLFVEIIMNAVVLDYYF